jgi:hypothetical protein
MRESRNNGSHYSFSCFAIQADEPTNKRDLAQSSEMTVRG